MAMRSWLFVPGDSDAKLEKAAGYGPDVVIVDLEDSVAPPAKPHARLMAKGWLERQGRKADGPARWVRINPLDTQLWREDLAAVMPGKPDGIMVPKAAGPEQLQALAGELGIASYAGAQLPRLAGLTWGAEDLSAAIGASRKRDERGYWTDAFRYVRAQVLLAAHARGVLAIDTLHAEFRDIDGLRRMACDSYSEGFSGMLAIHPSQVPVINQAFTPGEEEIARARAIVNAF